MHKVSQYYKLVQQIYEGHPNARDNDAVLVARVLAVLFGVVSWKQMTLHDYLYGVYKGGYPSVDTITRAGRKVRHDHKELRGSASAQQRRLAKQLITLQDLEYTGPAPADSRQLKLFEDPKHEEPQNDGQ